MLTSGQKNQIVSSYSKVLANVLSSVEEKDSILEQLREFVKKNDCSNFYINPLVLNIYKSEINNITISDKNNEIQQILLLIFKRCYGFLLHEIIESTKSILSDKINKIDVCVFSQSELSERFKSEISSVINSKVSNVKIDYRINKNLAKDSIDIISNDNVCSLNLKELSKSWLETK